MAAESERATAWWHRLLPALTLLGLLAAVVHAATVATVERSARGVLVVADQSSFLALLGPPSAAATAGPKAGVPSPQQLFGRLKAAGVGALGVSESGLGTLVDAGDVALLDGVTWEDRVRAGLSPAPSFALNPQATYVLVQRPSVTSWLRAELPRALGPRVPVRWYRQAGGVSVAMVPVAENLLGAAPLGFQPGSFALARDLGLGVVPRPASSLEGMSTAAALNLYRSIAAARTPVAALLFSGEATQPVPGGAGAAPAAAALLQARRWPLGVVVLSDGANLVPPGFDALASRMPGKLVRVYSVPALAEFTPAETRRLAQDIRAADARVVYIHPVVGAADPVRASIAYVASLTSDLKAQGLDPGSRPGLLPAVTVGPLQRLAQVVGAAAAAAWLAALWFPAASERRILGVGAASAVLLAGCALLGNGGLAALGVFGALAAAGLGAAAAARLWRVPDAARDMPGFGALWARAAAAGLVWAGSLAAGGLFALTASLDAERLLGWPAPEGVLAVHLLSLLLAAAAFAAGAGPGAPGWNGLLQRLARWADRPLTITAKQAAALALAVALVVVLRHKAVDVWVYALRAPWREAAGRWLLAPPSERAALVGFPAVLASAWCARRRLRWWFLLALLLAAYGLTPFFDVFTSGVVPVASLVAGTVVQAALGLVASAVALAVAAGVGDLFHRRVAVSAPSAENLQPGPP